MKRSLSTLAAIALLFATAHAAEKSTSAKITGIQAQLYYENTGKFSDNLLGKNPPSLWNTIIGEGESGGASNFTFVTVEVVGKNVPTGTVNLMITARGENKKIRATRTMNVSIYDEKTKFVGPLWIYDTGCEPLEITARLIGKNVSKTLTTATINFQCGE